MAFYYEICILPKTVLNMLTVPHLFMQEIFFSIGKNAYLKK